MGGCSPRRCPNGSAPMSRPPKSWGVASPRPAGPSTWSGAPCATPCSRAPRARPTPRSRPDHRRPAGRDRAAGAGLGRRHLDAGRALRHHRLPQGHPGLRDHDPPGRGLRARLAQARGHLRRRPGRGPVAPGLHHQRAGAPPARHGAVRSLRRPGGPGGRPAAHAARPGDLLRRRPAAHAARRALRGALLARAGPGADGGGGAHARPAVHRLGRAHPRRARQDRHGRRAVGGVVVRRAHRPGRRVPARAAGAGARAGPDPPAQGRAGAHAGRGRQDVTRTGCCAWPRSSTTSASRARAPSPTAA